MTTNNQPAKYTLGKYNFNLWGDVQDFCRTIIAKGCHQLNKEHSTFVLALLDYHPWGKFRKRCGINKIQVGKASIGTGYCLQLQDNSGTWMDFSFKKCQPKNKLDPVEARKSQDRQKRLRAYRAAIEAQTLLWRTQTQQKQCQCCSRTHSLAVDHITPFVEIVNQFEAFAKFDNYPPIKNDVTKLNGVSFSEAKPIDKIFILRWQEFHRQKATFQFLCNTCNSKKGSLSGGKRITYKAAS